MRRGERIGLFQPLCCLCDHLSDLGGDGRNVKRNAVLYRPFDAAGSDHLPVADLFDPGRIKHFEIFERIAVDDYQVGFEADTHAAELVLLGPEFSRCLRSHAG